MAFRIIVFFVVMLGTGCSGAQMLNAVSNGEGVRVSNGIAYGGLPRQKYDVYRPEGASAGPVIVFFYGGGWDSGERASYKFVGNALASQGFTVAIPDYRLSPQVAFPAFVEDAAKAVAVIRRDVADDRPVTVMGHSAGAHIAALVVLDSRYLSAEGLSPCGAVSAFVGLAGPYDFLPLTEERYKRAFPEPLRERSQPINHAAGTHPPALLIHGTADDVVEPRDSTQLARALRRSGNSARATLYDGIGHAELVGTLASPLRGRAPTLSDITAFVESRNGRNGC